MFQIPNGRIDNKINHIKPRKPHGSFCIYFVDLLRLDKKYYRKTIENTVEVMNGNVNIDSKITIFESV